MFFSASSFYEYDFTTKMSYERSGQVYDVEEILDHKKGANGITYYLVKWNGYDASNNSWEPEDNFLSSNVLKEYHKQLDKSSGLKKENLLPKKVLNITHIKGEEKNLVVQIEFEGADEPIYVYAQWANKHCPQLVIAYYETRIHWKEKSTVE